MTNEKSVFKKIGNPDELIDCDRPPLAAVLACREIIKDAPERENLFKSELEAYQFAEFIFEWAKSVYSERQSATIMISLCNQIRGMTATGKASDTAKDCLARFRKAQGQAEN